jgi:glycosyltransferase involved in cell wall biosynthesis
MEICIVCAFFYPFKGGIETQIYEMVERLYKNKINVKIISLIPKEDLPRLKEFPYAECIPVSVKRINISKFSPPPVVFYSPFEVMKKVEKECKNVEIIHSFNELMGAFAFRKKKDKIFIHSQHNTLKNGPNFFLWRNICNFETNYIFKKYYQKYDKLVSISKYIAEELKAYCDIKEEKIKVIPNGLNLKKFIYSKSGAKEFRKNNNIDKFFIFSTGRMVKEKGFDHLIKAVAEMNNKDVILGLGGDGYCKNELMNLVKKLKLDVKFFGYLTRADLNKAFCACDVFVTPSLFQEPFGLVNTEAMIFEKPVVASRVGGIPEIVKDGKTGFIYDSLNYKELTEKLNILYNDKKLGLKFGKEGRKRVKKYYNWDILIKDWINFYKTLI